MVKCSSIREAPTNDLSDVGVIIVLAWFLKHLLSQLRANSCQMSIWIFVLMIVRPFYQICIFSVSLSMNVPSWWNETYNWTARLIVDHTDLVKIVCLQVDSRQGLNGKMMMDLQLHVFPFSIICLCDTCPFLCKHSLRKINFFQRALILVVIFIYIFCRANLKLLVFVLLCLYYSITLTYSVHYEFHCFLFHQLNTHINIYPVQLCINFC